MSHPRPQTAFRSPRSQQGFSLLEIIIVLVLSLLVMRWSSAWVYYEGEVREKGGDRDA